MKSKIIKNLVLFSFFGTTLSAISCSNTSINKRHDLKIDVQTSHDEFEIFVQNKMIQELLKLCFGHDSNAANEYVNQQKELKKDYKMQISAALRYANHITYSLNTTRSGIWGYPKAETLEVADGKIEELLSKNWLFYLFNLNKMIFVQDEDDTGNDQESVARREEADENSLLYKNFYNPKSNRIIDYVIQKYSDDDYSSEFYIYFLTNEGFIFKINLTIYKEQQKPEISIFGYIYTFPKLLESKNKLRDFDLKKYILDTQSFADYDLYGSNTSEILFYDNYGGTKLVYVLADLKTD
ncbi:aromatic motif membrane protein [Mycoplasmopsis pullorum]|uniref:aromatic motif membrane protein n=2 Tax=Mycoplasmopsis pullorum TaxID=48003 RepID=UPI001117D8AA|nr:aromatic motif membrane protein [Mycoplasmopsis pullorum]TNK81538.1 hypothetical protein C4M94_03880 [Mycoplasmopsis pullorum]TNK82854.1 hypothetical protein C4M80_02150 [Mycoplasmopsis pullorum]TNK83400.1 hypothetical protein C4M81_03920 [Mycoplasmopsis pullorum]TNK84099.1 hypothetical protein C4M92_03945 [Mycoplasmopsis pullorum]TNK85273.1 hypothetical protein C4M85_03245 [Mycoplasmopsis pullorum]